MLRQLTIECPKCHLVCRMYLGTEAPAVVVRCPSCETSIMSFGGQVHVLNEAEADAVKRGDGTPVLRRMRSELPRSPASQSGGDTARFVVPHAIPVRLADMRGNRVVTCDDVLDLHRALHAHGDAGDFLDWIGAASVTRPGRLR